MRYGDGDGDDGGFYIQVMQLLDEGVNLGGSYYCRNKPNCRWPDVMLTDFFNHALESLEVKLRAAVRARMAEHPDHTVYFTGHSLGGTW